MPVCSVPNLLWYLERKFKRDDDFPWNKLSCFALMCYVIKKNHRSTHTLNSLDQAAKQYLHEGSPMERISQVFANSFIPEAQIHFTVPKLNDLSDTDRNLNQNEILAGFLDFLVQILYREAFVDKARYQLYFPLGQKLLFFLAILGDKPLDGNNQHSVFEEQVNDLLAMFEALANEAGSFIYGCVFSIPLVVDEKLNSKRNALVEKFDIMNVNIKQHCIKFSELSLHDVPRSNIVDSFFIIHSLVDDLDDFSPHKFSPMEDQIAMLHDELKSSQAVLKIIEARQDDGPLKESLGQIRDLAYDAEYLINSYVARNIHAWYLDLRLPSITQKIKIARERHQPIKEMQTSQVKMRNGGEISYVSLAPAENDNNFVELKDNTTERILADLVGKTKSSRQTVLIFGMPGLGKTTIANKLYRCTSVSDYFDRRVWCIVSQTYNVRSLLITILANLGHHLEKDKILEKNDAKLREDIHKSLMQMRYLIVLDDVWDNNAWNDLRRYLPDDRNGSRVIITSRRKDVAPDGSMYHTLPLFSEDQSWELLKKKIFLEEPCPAELIKTGMGIAEKCSGIPLAVITTAGILATLERKEEAWKRVEQQLDTLLLDDVSDYRKILELSYEHLPLTLKPCFLYFAAFPEDSEISINQLAFLWIAEGFIRRIEGKSQEQIAELHLLDLMNRSLVIPGKRGADGLTKTCRVHDLLLDICVMKANEENFLNSNNALSIYEKHQRSYRSSTSNTFLRPFGIHCRSLIGNIPHGSCLHTSALLKVVNTRPNKFQKYEAKSFDLPTRLRYLGVNHLTHQMVTHLDNLEFINIINSSQVKMPSIILRMKKLRHLIVKKEAMFENDGYVSTMTNLMTLLYICIDKPEDEAILRVSPRLQKLKCNVGGKMIFPDLSFLEELETLKLDFKSFSNKRHKMVSNLNFPSTLKNLCLSNVTMPWENMSAIGRLPNLCVLKLENKAFVGVKWETLDGEFEELRFLKMEGINLIRWTTCSEHFPKLERLVLVQCWDLEGIPCDLGNIPTLQRIDVEFCTIKAALSAVGIEQEQLEYGNTELRVNITANFWTKKELVDLFTKNMGISKNVSVLESDGEQMYELSSIICSPERDFLVRNNGEQIKVNALKGKIIGIYFAAFWLESCQLFTQKLMKVYNELKKYGHFEIVLVSSYIDDEEASFNLDFSKLPWMAIPISDSNARNKLSELFAIRTLPRLVILDENGKVLTEEGVTIVEENGGEGYHFNPECIPDIKQLEGEPKELIKQPEKDEDEDNYNYSLEYLLVSKTRDYVINNDGTKVPVSSLVGKTILLFFGANEILLCKQFNQKLVQTYQEINKETNNSVEVIFISFDEDEYSYKEFFATMPWLGLPFNDSKKHFLYRFYTVNLIPRLVVIGPTGKTVTDDGLYLVYDLGAEAYPFTSQRLKEIDDRMMKLCPKKVWNETHTHDLVLLTNTSVICDGCGDFGYYWVYRCEKCYFSLHPKCALGNGDKEQMTESKPNKEVQRKEDEEETSRNDSLESLLVSEKLDYVIDYVGIKIPVSNLVGKTILLFFAGDHSSRSRIFVPKLIKAYHEINEKYNNSVEVIFISFDEDEFTFEKFFVTMPWLALPFNDDRKESLVRLYKVKPINPMVVIIGPTCQTVTVEGYELILCYGADAYPFTSERVKEIEFENDMAAELWVKKVRNEVHEHELGLVKRMVPYYWCDGCNKSGCGWSYYCEDCDFDLHPECALGGEEKDGNDSLESLLVSDSGDHVIDLAGTQIRVSDLVGKKIMLFFGAHWCPPCRFVLPELIKKYYENKEKHNNSVEVIFISLDKNKSSYDEFFAMMPWLAIPFYDFRRKYLSRLFNVKATPMLVVVEPSGKVVEDKAWELISYPGQEAYPFTYEWVQFQAKAQGMVIFWPKKVTVKLHEHELCLVKQILYDCNNCHEVGFDWSYKCETCVFSLHANCALRDDKPEVKRKLEDEGGENSGSGAGST